MHDLEFTNERLENYCMAWGVDHITIQKFEEICEINLWDDYLQSVKLTKKIFSHLELHDFFDCVWVSPSFNEDYKNDLTYMIMYDKEQILFLSISIHHNISERLFSVNILEYDTRYCTHKDEEGYHFDNTYGPFLQDAPFKDQELHERCRMMYTKLSRTLRNENANC